MSSTNIRIVARLVILFLLVFSESAFAGTLKASWYSDASLKAEGTFKTSKGIMANGKRFNENDLTCACRMFPLNTVIKVTSLASNKSVIVKVTDRIGKRFAKTRIDLSKSAFAKIADLKQGLVPITVEVIR